VSGVLRYRDRAEELRARADAVAAPEVRVGYLELARQWDALADHAEALARRSPDLPEGAIDFGWL
jgi:hypothetical protein